jgi:hypothetical protein
MTDACDLCCERCGATAFSHFFGADRRGRRCWQNRCAGCGRASEYVPTRSEIASQCRELRAVQPLTPLDDEEEKLWRQLADPGENDDALDGDDDDWPAAA